MGFLLRHILKLAVCCRRPRGYTACPFPKKHPILPDVTASLASFLSGHLWHLTSDSLGKKNACMTLSCFRKIQETVAPLPTHLLFQTFWHELATSTQFLCQHHCRGKVVLFAGTSSCQQRMCLCCFYCSR